MVQPDFKMKLLSIINVMMTTSILFINLASSVPCTNPLPNVDLNKMLQGIDITTVDQFPLVGSVEPNHKPNLLAFTCNQKHTLVDNSTGKQYVYPDKIRPQVVNEKTVHVNVIKTIKDIEMFMSMELGSDNRYRSFTSIDTASYKKLQKDIVNTLNPITYTTTHFQNPTFVFDHPELSSDAKSYLKTILYGSFEANMDAYIRFVDKFGTHYRVDGIFDGAVKQRMEINSDGLTREIAQRMLDLELGKKPYTKGLFIYKNVAKKESIYYGGADEFKSELEFKKWRLSTKQNRWFYSTKLSPIYELMPNNVKYDFKKAIDVYLARKVAIQYVEKHTIYKNMPTEYMNHMIYKIVNTHGLNRKEVFDSIAKQIAYEISIPDWMKTNAKLCFHMQGANGGGCSPYRKCSPINKRNKSYYENTNKSGQTCEWRFKISVDGNIPRYFKDTKICMRAKASGAEKCAFRQKCAPVNEYLKYLDSPTTLSGYCSLSWKIQVPNHAPIWLKNIMLCFYWATANDPRSCGSDPGPNCASTGKWLPYYDDKTKGFTYSGCWVSMGWKINHGTKIIVN